MSSQPWPCWPAIRLRLAPAGLAALALVLAGCGVLDAAAPPAGPCALVRLDPAAGRAAAFDSGVPCVIVAWDTTVFPPELEPDGSVDQPGGLREAAAAAGYSGVCSTSLMVANADGPALAAWSERYMRLTPGAEAWNADLFLLGPAQDAHKGYCRDWLDIR